MSHNNLCMHLGASLALVLEMMAWPCLESDCGQEGTH